MNIAWQQPLVKIARDAGAAIMSFYQQSDTQTWLKKDDSPLTQADLAAHQVIVDGLTLLTPEIPVLSEESTALPWATRQTWDQYWLVDPLDGTKEFIKQNGEFTVNIALISNHQPVMAVVFAPALNKLYFANISQGCFFQQDNNDVVRLNLNKVALGDTVRVVGSRSHASPAMAQFTEQFSAVEIVPTGSSLKLCLVAQGLADIYPRLGPTMEWDTAAGQCIAQCAGARVTRIDGRALRYNQQDSLLNPFFIVSHPNLLWSIEK